MLYNRTAFDIFKLLKNYFSEGINVKRELIGRVGVDSGQLMIIDPCNIENQDVGEQIMGITNNENQAGQLKYNMGHDGLGVVFSSGLGDGKYDVYATYHDLEDWGERITKVEIVLIDEDE